MLCQKWKGLNVYAPGDDEYMEIFGTIADFEWRSISNSMIWVSVVEIKDDKQSLCMSVSYQIWY